MRSYTRQQLKQNAFAETTADTIHWAVAHRSKLVIAGIVLAVIVAIGVGSWGYISYRNQRVPSGTGRDHSEVHGADPHGRDARNSRFAEFCLCAGRAKVTNGEFSRIADKYSFTESGALARYFVGVVLFAIWATTQPRKSSLERSPTAGTKTSPA